MHNDLDANAQLEVEISNLVASEAEFEKAQSLIQSGLGANMSPITINSLSNFRGSLRYGMTFRVFDPRGFRKEKVQEWLHEAGLVGWRLNATFVRPS